MESKAAKQSCRKGAWERNLVIRGIGYLPTEPLGRGAEDCRKASS